MDFQDFMEILGTVVFVALIIFLVATLTAVPVMLLWNWLMVMLFRLPSIGLWEALGITLLCELLFKSHNKNIKKE
jgi:hypothetical protein